jgi:hypothetical protein
METKKHLERKKHWEILCTAMTVQKKLKKINKFLNKLADSSISDDICQAVKVMDSAAKSIIDSIDALSNDVVILDEKIVHTDRYGNIRFIKTPDGWVYRFDRILIDAADVAREQGEEHPYYLSDQHQPSGVWNLEDTYLDDEYLETYEQAYNDMLVDMSNLRLMGLIATWC